MIDYEWVIGCEWGGVFAIQRFLAFVCLESYFCNIEIGEVRYGRVLRLLRILRRSYTVISWLKKGQ